LSFRKVLMNSTGSYNENLRPFSVSPDFSWPRQGEVSQTMGMLPLSDAFSRDCSSALHWLCAASMNPLVLKIIPQQELFRPCTRSNVHSQHSLDRFIQMLPSSQEEEILH
jgi:hypothetical protein